MAAEDGEEEEERRIVETAAVRKAPEAGDTGLAGAGEATGNILLVEREDTGRTGLARADIVPEEAGTGLVEADSGRLAEEDTGHSPGEEAVLRCVRFATEERSSAKPTEELRVAVHARDATKEQAVSVFFL